MFNTITILHNYIIINIFPDVDECSENPCVHGKCINDNGTFHCECDSTLITGDLCDKGMTTNTLCRQSNGEQKHYVVNKTRTTTHQSAIE